MASTPPPPPPGPPGSYPPSGYAPQPYAAQPYPVQPYAPAVLPFKRNAMLILAQVLAIVQGVLMLLAGIGIILLAIAGRSALQTAINNNNFTVNGSVVDINTAMGVFIGAGAVVIIIGLLVTFLAIRTGRPSQIARWFLAIIEVLFLLAALRGLGAGGNAGISAIVDVVWTGLVIIGLVIWPTTYAAYARRNLPATTAAPRV